MGFYIIALTRGRIGTLAGPYKSAAHARADMTRMRYIAASYDSRAFAFTLHVDQYDATDLPGPIVSDVVLCVA